MRKLLISALIVALSSLSVIKAQGEFSPKIKVGAGTILQTVYQTTPDKKYVFEPAMLKVGFLHTDIQVTDKLSGSVSWAFHSGKLSDAFMKYQFVDEFAVQIGRFKGAGSRAGSQTVQYDTDFGEFTYFAENLAAASGAPDFRFYGLDLSGKTKYMAYKFTLHNSGSERTRYYSGANDGPKVGENNHGLEFKSWDASVCFFPMQNLEVGGHLGSISRPGMGYKNNYSWTGHAYYVVPDKYKVKVEGGAYREPVFHELAGPLNHSNVGFHNSSKYGISALIGYNITPNFEPVVRYEYFNHGDLAKSGVGYKGLNLWTVGANYYFFPENKRAAKISAFYQSRGETGGASFRNDWIGISYQIFLMM